MATFTPQELKRRAFERVAMVLKHFYDEQEQFWDGPHVHSRIFDTLVHDEYIEIGKSEGVVRIGIRGYREHLVPCAYIRDLAFRMYHESETVAEVANMVEKCLKIVWITPEEAQRLDSAHKSTMPSDWHWKTDSVFRRIEDAGDITITLTSFIPG